MSMVNPIGLKKLQYFFPKLPEEKQEYILGVAEGLKYMQAKYGSLVRPAPYTNSQGQPGGRGVKWEN